MPCDTKIRRKQTLAERKEEIKTSVATIDKLISAGRVKVVVDKATGAVAFTGIDETVRADMTDACVYRRILSQGSALAKMALQRAEQMAGRRVDGGALAQGIHSHDGGATWGRH